VPSVADTPIVPSLVTVATTIASEKANVGNVTFVGLEAIKSELSIIIVLTVLSFKLCSKTPSDLSPVTK